MKRTRLYAALLALGLVGCAVSPAPAAEPVVIPQAKSESATDPVPADTSPNQTTTADTPAETPDDPIAPPDDTALSAALHHFGVSLLQNVTDGDENCLLSPLSAYAALAMAANGADGETLAQMEAVLGMELAVLNAAVPGLMPADGPLQAANGIWFRDDPALTVEETFLQICAEVYQANAQQVPFDAQTLAEINQWVNDQTAGMIPTLLEELSPELALLLVNALSFDAKWETPYESDNLREGIFTAASGETQPVEMMHSTEGLYLDDGSAIGFVKPYEGGRYAFAALMPNEDVSMTDYLAQLTGEGLHQTLQNAQRTEVEAGIPAFSAETTAELRDALTAMGMADAFDPARADLTAMGGIGLCGLPLANGSRPAEQALGGLFIDAVLQKTFIEVDAQGTKAAAATAVMADTLSMPMNPPKCVILNRPFVYLIVDLETNQPLFLGTMVDMQ